MQRTPLNSFHVEKKAKMVDFAGWEMPMFYTGILEEHQQVRKSGGLFDVSHMGRVKVTGRHARKFLEKLCTRKIFDMTQGQCRYSLVCNEQGGVKDDIIVYRFDEDDFLLVVNASNREKLLPHFEKVKGDLQVKIDDQTLSTAMVAMQGPKVMDMISKFSSEIPTLKRYRFTTKNLMIMKVIVSRTGYTGEDGVEAILPATFVGMAMKLILKDVDMTSPDAIVKPAGLGCRDTLRIEAGMPLYGHELGEEINALECGVDFAISLDKHEGERGERFVGQDALEAAAKAGVKRKLVGIALEGKRSARQGMKVMSGGTEVGVVTSGCSSPTLGYPIAMAFVDVSKSELGTPVQIECDRGTFEGKVVKMPFYSPTKKG
ncbi:MAG: glycine cleavage system aminomethyltransferase GcvT [Phycisphaeraceae bacterium]|nr:glycine cleavage system aminomethyltransferase GcvT [Phycisphaeraceae bacterium]